MNMRPHPLDSSSPALFADEALAGQPEELPHDPFDISAIAGPQQAIAALEQARHGVITGEGPTTRGRVHHSRTLDAQDAILCERILIAAGQAGEPVSRAEADLLFAIQEAAFDREDDGRFDDLFVKAVAHHVLAAAGRSVPARDLALAPATRLEDWAVFAAGGLRDEAAIWLEQHLRRSRRTSAPARMLHTLLAGMALAPAALSLRSVLDLAA